MTLSVETLAEVGAIALSAKLWATGCGDNSDCWSWEVMPKRTQDIYRAGSRQALQAVLTAIEQAGYVVVPREATEEMCDAGRDAHFRKRNDMSCIAPTEHPEDGGGPFGYAWRAMLSAAPNIQHSEGE